MPHQILIRPVAMAAALVVAAVFATPLAQAQSTGSASAQAINIPAMPLEQALQRFIELTKFQLVYSPEILRGATSKPVTGAMTPREALPRMLEGTGVQVVYTGEGAATLRPTNTAAALSSGAAAGQLPASLESVTVTATKRPSTGRELAGSVTALQGEDLEQRGAVGYEEYLKLAPGVQYNKSESGYATLSIRGLSTQTGVGPTQGTTGIYVEDVPFTDPFSVIALPDLGAFDFERVEVLRGPQGVLFGSSSLGGALRFVLNKPNLKRNEGSVQVTGSRTGGGGTNYGVAAMANFAAADSTLGLRVVAYDREESGYIHNTATGEQRTNATHQRGGRVLATWKPTPQLEVTGIVATEEGRIADSSAVSDPSRWETNTAARQPRKLATDFGNLQVNYDLGGAKLTSNTGYLRKRTVISTDLGRALGPLFGSMVPQLTASTNNAADAVSQEFRIANREPSNFNWLAGLFYQRFNQHYDGRFAGAGVSSAAEALYGPMFTAPVVQSLTAGDTFFSQDIGSRATETAVFGDVEWRATKQWSVTAGARAYKTTMAQDGRLSGLLNYFGEGVPTTSRSSTTSDTGVTPKVSVKYTTESGNVFYALASKGYRFGGVNFIPPTGGFSSPTSFKSDNLWNYEVGTRLTMLDRKLFVDVTAFRMDWKDAQIIVVRPDNFAYVDNVGKARSTGLELSMRARPTSALTLGAGLAATDARTLVASGTAPANSRLPGTARTQGFVDASYRFDGPLESTGVASLTYSRVGKYFNDLQQTAELGGYGTADLNIRFIRDNYELTLFARNLTNEMGKVGATAAPGMPYKDYYLTKPRSVGVTLRADF